MLDTLNVFLKSLKVLASHYKVSYLEHIMVDSDIYWGLAFAVFSKQCGVPSQQEPQTILVTIFRAKVGGGVSINVLSVHIRPRHQQSLDDSKIPSNAGDV